MKFVFCDKSDLETDIITNVLYTEKIPYKLKSKKVHCCFIDEEEEDVMMPYYKTYLQI